MGNYLIEPGEPHVMLNELLVVPVRDVLLEQRLVSLKLGKELHRNLNAQGRLKWHDYDILLVFVNGVLVGTAQPQEVNLDEEPLETTVSPAGLVYFMFETCLDETDDEMIITAVATPAGRRVLDDGNMTVDEWRIEGVILPDARMVCESLETGRGSRDPFEDED